MKRLTVVMMFLLFCFYSMVSADQEIGVFVNLNTNCIQFIDPETNIATEHYLKGDLGSYSGGLLDVVITHDGKTAIVSNFGDSKIFFIDISAGFNAPPTILGTGRPAFFAEDMAITPNDQYVLIADGGLSSNIAVVDIATHQLIRRNHLGSRDAQAVAITPDGETVLVADYFGRKIHSYTLDYDNGRLIHKKSVRITPFMPVNIAISPDGRTAIAAIAGFHKCAIFYFDDAGELFHIGDLHIPSYNGQSCVFSRDGTKAYYLSNSDARGTLIHILTVTGPGNVILDNPPEAPNGIKIWPRRGSGQFFGVDTIALNPDESFLYVTNPTSFGTIADVALIDLSINQQVGYIPATGFPTGIAFTEIEEEGDGN
jgi:DNA-binding beta-propeller fold protein YncE